MYLAQETPEEFKRLDARAKAVLAEILTKIPPSKPGARIPSGQDVFSIPERQGKLYLVKDGVLSYAVEGRILFYFEPGDLVGAEHLLTGGKAQILSDFAVVVDEFDGTELLRAVCGDVALHRKWSEYLVLQSSLLVTLSGSLISAAPASTADVATFMPGEEICAEGSPADFVFALVEGEAEAKSGQSIVGNIQAGEIFGVLAAVTEIPRQATVTAITECLVMVLPRDNFLHIIESKPATILKMIQEMGQTLINVNQTALSLSFSKF